MVLTGHLLTTTAEFKGRIKYGDHRNRKGSTALNNQAKVAHGNQIQIRWHLRISDIFIMVELIDVE